MPETHCSDPLVKDGRQKLESRDGLGGSIPKPLRDIYKMFCIPFANCDAQRNFICLNSAFLLVGVRCRVGERGVLSCGTGTLVRSLELGNQV